MPNAVVGGDRWWEETLFRGVTLYPWATMDTDAVVKDLVDHGVNAINVVTKESDGRVFYDSDVAPPQVPNRDLLAELIAAADGHNVAIIPSMFVLCDKYLLDEHPETVQIARDGTELRHPNVSAEWMHWVCPNHEPVREHLQAIVEELATYDIDGIQFTHIEFQPVMNGDSTYLSCFCDACIEHHETHEDNKTDDWVDVRCETITKLITELTVPIHDREDIMVNTEMEAFADLESAIADSRETLGVDPISIADFADIFTLRTPHVDIDKHPLWVRDGVRSLRKETATPIVPSIKTSSGERPMTAIPDDELMTAIQMAFNGGSQGVSLFSTGANVGRITEDQWEAIEAQYEELASFERKYGLLP